MSVDQAAHAIAGFALDAGEALASYTLNDDDREYVRDHVDMDDPDRACAVVQARVRAMGTR